MVVAEPPELLVGRLTVQTEHPRVVAAVVQEEFRVTTVAMAEMVRHLRAVAVAAAESITPLELPLLATVEMVEEQK